ncbi:MAG: hypothetical protein M1393_08550 [Candidatus Thermoplasmatota archaeon]|nr:hypothetical protein [Candidatus Thermoplasmatota archaeon]MDA8144414.1 hypothetical protein [Thermoplasmatales archaeon]
MPLKKPKEVEPEDEGMEEEQEVSITLGKDELSAINLLRSENETVVQVIRRALQDSLEYGVMKHVLSSIDGRIADLSKKYKISQSSIINFRYDVEEGMRVPEELRKKEDNMTKIMNLKASLEKKWAEVEKNEK